MAGTILDLYVGKIALGDALGYTAIMNATPACLHMLDCEQNRNLAHLFYGIGNVEFTKEERHTNEEIRGMNTHFTRKILRHYGLERYSCTPRIKLTPQEVGYGRQWIRQYTNPFVIRDLASGRGGRSIPPAMAQALVDANPERTFINFGTSASHPLSTQEESKLERVVYIYDLPIRMVAAIYYAIGRYVGADTGNFHLMLAVGGKCDVLIPDHGHNGYHYAHHLYPEDAHGGEERRLNYVAMSAKHKRSICGLRYPESS